MYTFAIQVYLLNSVYSTLCTVQVYIQCTVCVNSICLQVKVASLVRKCWLNSPESTLRDEHRFLPVLSFFIQSFQFFLLLYNIFFLFFCFLLNSLVESTFHEEHRFPPIFSVLFRLFSRVGHRVLFRLVRSVLFRSLKGTFHSFPFFFEFLVTYETQKNVPFWSVLF